MSKKESSCKGVVDLAEANQLLKYMNTNVITKVTFRDLDIIFSAQTSHVTWTCCVPEF